MLIQSPASKNHLINRQYEIDAQKLKEMQKCNLFNERTFYRAFLNDVECKKISHYLLSVYFKIPS